MSGTTTKLIHNGYNPNNEHGAVTPPIYLSATYVIGNDGGFDYSRSGNPTRELLETTLAALDGGQFGLAFSSGSAALATATQLLEPGQGFLASRDTYGGTFRYITQVLQTQQKHYYLTDFTDLEATEACFKANDIHLVWVETPTNPLLKVVDIEALAKLAHTYGALLAVDNTLATPILQKPLQYGADIVAYSTTKYMNGHCDSIGGALVVNEAQLFERLKFLQNAVGAILSPFDSWLTLRGLRTLELRMERHVHSAGHIAELLQSHSKIKHVYYPSFFTGEQKAIVAKQQSGPGAIVTIELAKKYNVQKFLQALKYFPLAVSLGSFESLIDHPVTMSHKPLSLAATDRAKAGLGDNLLRISVGLENTDDLLADLSQALEVL